MTEIAQLFESALRQNRSSLLRQAAMNTVARMPAETTLSELLESDAGDAIRELTLADLRKSLREGGLVPRRKTRATPAPAKSDAWDESREERVFRRIMEQIATGPLTIGQLSKGVEIEVDELRGYLDWMMQAGKITTSGRARGTRYRAVAE